MARLNREESQAHTRARLLTVAQSRFAADGYKATSLERIAEEAGFSKGAVYSNFSGKAELFLEVLEEHGRISLAQMLSEIDDAPDIRTAIDRIAAWATYHSRKGNWPLLILEYARHARPSAKFHRTQEEILRKHWRILGERLTALMPPRAERLDIPPETIGALVFELTYAPAMSFVKSPTSGDLLQVSLGALFGLNRPTPRAAPAARKKTRG